MVCKTRKVLTASPPIPQSSHVPLPLERPRPVHPICMRPAGKNPGLNPGSSTSGKPKIWETQTLGNPKSGKPKIWETQSLGNSKSGKLKIQETQKQGTQIPGTEYPGSSKSWSLKIWETQNPGNLKSGKLLYGHKMV